MSGGTGTPFEDGPPPPGVAVKMVILGLIAAFMLGFGFGRSSMDCPRSPPVMQEP